MAKVKPRKFAVFDIDGTIFRSSLLIELVEELISEKIFPESSRAVYNSAHRAWLDRKGSYENYIQKVITAFDKYVRGVREQDLTRAAKKVASFHRHRVYRYTRDLVKKLKQQNYFLLAVSHSPKYIVDDFARQLGFDKIYGRLLEVNSSGKLTGQAKELALISDKSKILDRAIQKENLTLQASVGVGDTESDISFLKKVDRPICFNPNQALYKTARRFKWEVVVERKDVIYEIKF